MSQLHQRLKSDGIAVYVYRQVVPTPPSVVPSSALEFLQLLRSDFTGEYQNSWQIVYGGIEAGETAIAAALRELREETGLAPRKLFQVEYLESFYFQHTDYVTVMPVFAAEVFPEAVIRLNHEHTAARWVPAGDVGRDFMWRSQREAIAIILETLANPGPAHAFLAIDLAKYRR